MKNNFLIVAFFVTIIAATNVLSAPQPYGPYKFGEGLNLIDVQTEIKDGESSNMCDCMPYIVGTVSPRFGTSKFVDQAISSWPITSIARVYRSTGSSIKKHTLVTAKDMVFYSSSDTNPFWTVLSSNNYADRWNWLVMNNKALGVGGLNNDIKSFDIVLETMSNLIQVDASTIPINNSIIFSPSF